MLAPQEAILVGNSMHSKFIPSQEAISSHLSPYLKPLSPWVLVLKTSAENICDLFVDDFLVSTRVLIG